jgi:parallel beta-helix repeat protein
MRPEETVTGLEFWLAPEGDDRHPGTREAPFASLNQGRDAVRRARAQGHGGPVRIWLRGGTYQLATPLRLTGQDSGTPTAPVTWAACPGETAVLSGGRQVTDWRPWRGAVVQADLAGSRGGQWPYRQLFYRGQRQPRCRWPKADAADPLYGGWAYTEGPATPDSIDAFVYRPGTLPRAWAKPTQVEVIYWASIGGWGSRVPIRHLDRDQRCITLAHGGWQFDVPGWYMPVVFGADNRFYVENALEELTEPGEWCFDGETGTLYFWPPDDTAAPVVTVPWLETLVQLHGVSWVQLEGLTFAHTGDGDNFHREGVEGTGAMYPRPGWRYCGEAVHLKDAGHCRLAGCHFDAVGGNGVYLEGDCQRNEIVGNQIAAAGANGICLAGTRLRHPFANLVTDNHIHHGGQFCKYSAGVFCGRSHANQVNHNRIEYLPHHGINLGNNPWGRNWVEYNLIRWVDQEVADSAAINCWMEDPPDPGSERCGHVIRGNVISDVYGCEVTDGRAGRSQRFPTSGIYLDNYASNCLVSDNLIVRCTHAGIVIHAGRGNVIEGNTVVDCRVGWRFQDCVSAMAYWRPMQGFMTGNLVRGNLWWHRGPDGHALAFQAWTDRVLARCDGNVYSCGDGPVTVEMMDTQQVLTLAQWQELGYDRGSQVAAPGFVDAAGDDFRLGPAAPARQLGLTGPDPERAGRRPPWR